MCALCVFDGQAVVCCCMLLAKRLLVCVFSSRSFTWRAEQPQENMHQTTTADPCLAASLSCICHAVLLPLAPSALLVLLLLLLFRLDVPKAPELLGRLVGGAAAACSSSGSGGSFSLAALGPLLEGAEGAEGKRAFGAATFKAYAAAAGGQQKLAEAVGAAGLKGEALFAADEFDGDLPSVADWLKAEGYGSLGL